MKPFKGWKITAQRDKFAGKSFLAAKDGQELMALTLKRLKLKINAALMIPQIVDKSSNFV